MSLNSRLGAQLEAIDKTFCNNFGVQGKEALDYRFNTYYAGGCINSAIQRQPAKDFDLFFNHPDTARTFIKRVFGIYPGFKAKDGGYLTVKEDKEVEGLWLGSLNLETPLEKVNEYFAQNTTIAVRYVTDNAITLRSGQQLIFRFIGPPSVVFETFDYDHCKVYWCREPTGPYPGSVVFTPEASLAIAKRQLVYTKKSRFALSALVRMNKFVRRGYTIEADSLVNLALTLGSIDFSHPVSFKEEILGLYGITPAQVAWVTKESLEGEKINVEKAVKLLGEL